MLCVAKTLYGSWGGAPCITRMSIHECRKSTVAPVSQLHENPTVSKDRLTRIKANVLYMNPRLLTATNHDESWL